ncbi:MAG TPA: hypothetical protein VFW07_03140 [Parafilimonas sp.]|nr:hypothetical protein [Parafilimonas sp.]
MQELLLQMLEAARREKKKFMALKNAVIACQQFELAAELREIERELFPETEEVKEAKALAEDASRVLRWVKIDMPKDVCWLVAQAMKKYFEPNGEFSQKDAAGLVDKYETLFEIEWPIAFKDIK